MAPASFSHFVLSMINCFPPPGGGADDETHYPAGAGSNTDTSLGPANWITRVDSSVIVRLHLTYILDSSFARIHPPGSTG